MPRRISKRPTDVNQAAFQMVERSTGEQLTEDSPPAKARKPSRQDISRVMSAMGKKGGKIGGKRSLITLTSEERRERALIAARARWAKRKKSE
jgi:hypothetical protein